MVLLDSFLRLHALQLFLSRARVGPRTHQSTGHWLPAPSPLVFSCHMSPTPPCSYQVSVLLAIMSYKDTVGIPLIMSQLRGWPVHRESHSHHSQALLRLKQDAYIIERYLFNIYQLQDGHIIRKLFRTRLCMHHPPYIFTCLPTGLSNLLASEKIGAAGPKEMAGQICY